MLSTVLGVSGARVTVTGLDGVGALLPLLSPETTAEEAAASFSKHLQQFLLKIVLNF
jgi:hypothetical protein